MKRMIWIGMGIGSTLGGAAPLLWGNSAFSMTSVFLTAIGGFLGIWAAFKLGRAMGL